MSRTALMAEAIALLVKSPRTAPELRDMLGCGKSAHYAYIDALRAEGLIYICDWKRRSSTWTAVYAWQPSVCHYSDAMKPGPLTLSSRGRPFGHSHEPQAVA